MRFREDPTAAAKRLGIEVGHISGNDYMMWAIVFRADQPSDPAKASSDPSALRAAALNEIGGFHPDFKTLVEKSEPNDAVLVPVRAMPRLRSGRASRVTLIGDAVHAMPPFGAHGANTALRGSQALAAALIRGDSSSVKAAVAAYESEMRGYRYGAVRGARRMMRLATADFPFKTALLVAIMRIAGAFSG